MDNREMIKVFFEIDKNQNGVITKKELTEYTKKRGFYDSDVENFLDIFADFDDEIRFEEFCSGLGEDMADYYYPERHQEDIEIISSKMNSFHKEWIVANIIRRAQSSCKDNRDVAGYVKKAMDRQLEELWHCVIVRGQYWAFYSHEPEGSVVIKHKNNIFIIFKTPGN